MSPNQPKSNDTVFGFEALPSFEDFLSSWDIAGSTPDSEKNRKNTMNKFM